MSRPELESPRYPGPSTLLGALSDCLMTPPHAGVAQSLLALAVDALPGSPGKLRWRRLPLLTSEPGPWRSEGGAKCSAKRLLCACPGGPGGPGWVNRGTSRDMCQGWESMEPGASTGLDNRGKFVGITGGGGWNVGADTSGALALLLMCSACRRSAAVTDGARRIELASPKSSSGPCSPLWAATRLASASTSGYQGHVFTKKMAAWTGVRTCRNDARDHVMTVTHVAKS